jgi:hypothetical protein
LDDLQDNLPPAHLASLPVNRLIRHHNLVLSPVDSRARGRHHSHLLSLLGSPPHNHHGNHHLSQVLAHRASLPANPQRNQVPSLPHVQARYVTTSPYTKLKLSNISLSPIPPPDQQRALLR